MNPISRLVTLLLLAAALSACATPAEMRQRSPEMELKSTLTSKSVSICIADRWESACAGTTPINMRPIEGGYTVSWRNEVYGHTGMLVDVKDTLDGSLTRYFKNMVIGEGTFDQIVIDCQYPTKKTGETNKTKED